MMIFNIRKLDKLEEYSEENEEALFEYQDTLVELFYGSPEGQEHRKTYPEMGFWAAQLIYYGYEYIGVTIPQMTVENVDEIVTEIFPRKISLSSQDETRDALPELIAFWEYLNREYKLRKADAIVKFLKGIKPGDFIALMNDPSRFGMAKSFFMAGKAAGFDMTNEKEMKAFMHLYNATLIAKREELLGDTSRIPNQKKRDEAKEKRKRKIAKAVRKRSVRKKHH